jgi:hypothetical protein
MKNHIQSFKSMATNLYLKSSAFRKNKSYNSPWNKLMKKQTKLKFKVYCHPKESFLKKSLRYHHLEKILIFRYKVLLGDKTIKRKTKVNQSTFRRRKFLNNAKLLQEPQKHYKWRSQIICTGKIHNCTLRVSPVKESLDSYLKLIIRDSNLD